VSRLNARHPEQRASVIRSRHYYPRGRVGASYKTAHAPLTHFARHNIATAPPGGPYSSRFAFLLRKFVALFALPTASLEASMRRFEGTFLGADSRKIDLARLLESNGPRFSGKRAIDVRTRGIASSSSSARRLSPRQRGITRRSRRVFCPSFAGY